VGRPGSDGARKPAGHPSDPCLPLLGWAALRSDKTRLPVHRRLHELAAAWRQPPVLESHLLHGRRDGWRDAVELAREGAQQPPLRLLGARGQRGSVRRRQAIEHALDGTVCHQIMADYQAPPSGGDGYFRLLRIWRDGRVQVRTFSPYVDPANAYLTEDRNQFDLHIDLPGG
jgi:hypothetical protein